MSLVERVAEAIDETAGHVLRGQANVWRADPRAIARAVLEALGFVTCRTCGGKGRIYTEPSDPGYFCPDCRLGVIPSEAMIKETTTGLDKHPDLYEIGRKDLEALKQLGFRPAKVKNEYIVKDVLAALLAAIGETPEEPVDR